MKEETRIDGPGEMARHQSSKTMQNVQGIEKPRPWQQTIMEIAAVFETRHIHVIIDTIGGIGKSTLQYMMMTQKLAWPLPPVNDFKDIVRAACGLEERPAYMFDMPRAMKKEKMHAFFAGIEYIKSGWFFDDRYSIKMELRDCPNIFIFTNTPPDLSLASRDRWKLWHIVQDHLVQWKDQSEMIQEWVESRESAQQAAPPPTLINPHVTETKAPVTTIPSPMVRRTIRIVQPASAQVQTPVVPKVILETNAS